MRFADIVSRVEDISNVTSKDDLIKAGIQAGLDDLTSRDLIYLSTPGVIRTIDEVTDGTVSVTNGSRTVTGTSTAFTSAMVGRKIRISSENTFYRITAVATTSSLTLDIEYAGTTDTAATYSIFKDEYRLAPDVDAFKIFREQENNQPIFDIEPSTFDMLEPAPTAEGPAMFSVTRGTKLDIYNTGTVNATVNTSVITDAGSTAVWDTVEQLGKGNRITIGSNVYTIKSVDSATQITIYEDILATVSGSAYEILMDNLIIQFYQISDETRIIRYRYQRIVFPLFNDQDIPDLPDNNHRLLIDAGLVWAWATKDKDQSNIQKQFFEAQKRGFWKRQGFVSGNRTYRRRNQTLLGTSRTGPLLAANLGPAERINI